MVMPAGGGDPEPVNVLPTRLAAALTGARAVVFDRDGNPIADPSTVFAHN